MVHSKPTLVNDKLYTKKIMQIYWLMVLMAFIGQILGLIITILSSTPKETLPYILENVILPTSIQAIILLSMQWLITYKKMYSVNLLIIVGTAATFITVASHPTVTGLQVLFLLIMAVSLVYFDKKKLRFSLIINMIALTSLYLFPEIKYSANEYEYISYLFVLIAGYMVYLIIVKRGNEALQVLQQAIEKEQHLMVKSTTMERLAKIDALTNLYNHKTFHEYMDFMYEQSISQGMALQLAIIDIDNFKMVNDTYGHSNGDVVIRRVASTLTKMVTENDIVARYGGEEFTILLTNKTLDETYEIIEDIRLHIANQEHDEIDEKVTVSIGLTSLEGHMTKENFFRQADSLLYAAKRNGKNQVVVEREEELKSLLGEA